MKAPVILFVYKRLSQTIKTIESLDRNILANETELYIYSDYAKDGNDIEKVNEVRRYIDKYSLISSFKRVHIQKSTINKGLASSVISGVSEVLSQFKECIVLEDDLVTSKDFLVYMNDALRYYKEDKNIWSISGYTFEMNSLVKYEHDVYLSYRGSSWGWATWIDRWQKVDWDLKNYSFQKFNILRRLRFNRGGRDLSRMLDAQFSGNKDSWAIRWCYCQSNEGMYTIYPKKSRVKNIGMDGSGTHSGLSNDFDTKIVDENEKCQFEKVRINKFIVLEFKEKFLPAFSRRAIRRVKHGLSNCFKLL